MLDRIAALACRHPHRVVAIAAVAAACALTLGGSALDRLHPYSATDPDSDSTRAADRVHELIGLDPDPGLIALVRTPGPVRTEAARRRVEGLANRIFLDPAVAFVRDVLVDAGPGLGLARRSLDLHRRQLRDPLGSRPAARDGADPRRSRRRTRGALRRRGPWQPRRARGRGRRSGTGPADRLPAPARGAAVVLPRPRRGALATAGRRPGDRDLPARAASRQRAACRSPSSRSTSPSASRWPWRSITASCSYPATARSSPVKDPESGRCARR